MKEYVILVIKGFIIGIANIIPGVSGGTLAITLGIYERVIEAISHFFAHWRENLKLLTPLGIGAVLSLLLMSKLLSYCLDRFPIPTTLFFLGLIIGGIPLLRKKIKKKFTYKNGIFFLLTFGLVLVFAFWQGGNNAVSLETVAVKDYLILFLVGCVAAATMVIPGISGSFVLMLLGFYKPILETVSHLTKMSELGHNLAILIPFGIGVVIGIVLIAKLIEYLLDKHETATYFGILGFVLASLLTIVKPLFGVSISWFHLPLGLLTLLLGSFLAYKLGEE